MTSGNDDEQLIAEALRAKAGQSAGATTPLPAEETDQIPQYPGPPARPTANEPRPLASGWILLLAILLGLATGAMIGLLTVL